MFSEMIHTYPERRVWSFRWSTYPKGQCGSLLLSPGVSTSYSCDFQNLCLFKNPCNFLLALVLLPLKDLYYILIAIQSGVAFGVKAVGQPIDKLSKY